MTDGKNREPNIRMPNMTDDELAMIRRAIVNEIIHRKQMADALLELKHASYEVQSLRIEIANHRSLLFALDSAHYEEE